MIIATIKLHNKGLCICLPQEAEWASITHSHSPGKKEKVTHLAEKKNDAIRLPLVNIKND